MLSGKTTVSRKIRESKKHVQLFAPSGLCSYFTMNKLHINYLKTVYRSKFKFDEQVYVIERSLFTNYIYFNEFLNKSNLSQLEKALLRKSFNKDLHYYVKLLKKCKKKFNDIIYVSLTIDEHEIPERVEKALNEKHDFFAYSVDEVSKQANKYLLLETYIEEVLKDNVRILSIKSNEYDRIFETK